MMHKTKHGKSETVTLIKDALGAFAVMIMLYVGLFITSL